MRLPNKIGIVDSPQSTDSRLRFDNWEGYDSIMQRKYLALKLNEIIDFLAGHPSIANDFPEMFKQEGDTIVHEHDWRLVQRLGSRGVYDCKICGETVQRFVSPGQA